MFCPGPQVYGERDARRPQGWSLQALYVGYKPEWPGSPAREAWAMEASQSLVCCETRQRIFRVASLCAMERCAGESRESRMVLFIETQVDT